MKSALLTSASDPTPPLTEPAKRGRGRPPRTEPQHVAAASRVKQLEEELNRARASERAASENRKRILGASCLAALGRHPDKAFRHALGDWLRSTVTHPAERAEIADLLVHSGE